MGDNVRIIKLAFKWNHNRNGKKMLSTLQLMSEADYQYTQQ